MINLQNASSNKCYLDSKIKVNKRIYTKFITAHHPLQAVFQYRHQSQHPKNPLILQHFETSTEMQNHYPNYTKRH
ncbi:hypothetical protein Hanom_Chr16g01498011 [Helianthus anomalus]